MIFMKNIRISSVAFFIAVAFSLGFAQEIDTAYVPVFVNVDANVAIEPPAGSLHTGAVRDMTANKLDTLKLLLKDASTPVLPGQQRQANKNADISLFSINGKQVLRGKASANIPEGVYLLLVKGVGGSSFASKPIVHNGGELSINVAFGSGDFSAGTVRKEAGLEAWTVKVQTVWMDTAYAFYPVTGVNEVQNIILLRSSSSSNVASSSSLLASSSSSSNVASSSSILLSSSSMPKCNGTPYNPQEQRCQGNVLESKCGTNWYKVSTQFCDSRENKIYKSVTIGTQVWMAENLNYNVSGSKCYKDDTANCTTYGRLYNWTTAMNLSASCNSISCSSQIKTPHQGICPSGWHIPSNADWDKLLRYVDYGDLASGTSSPYYSTTAGRKLKAKSGWTSCGPSGSINNYVCEDTYGFSALPGGYGKSDGGFYGVDLYGHWWSANEFSIDYAYYRYIDYSETGVYVDKYARSILYSVRCLQD